MEFRSYDPERDREAVQRIWREVGWLEDGQEDYVSRFLSVSRGWVAEIDGSPESYVGMIPGSIRYLRDDLPLSVASAVTTSRIARKQRIASRLTAHAIAADAADGALVSSLGMFEQGYYNRLGFGTGSYEHRLAFDPSDLTVDVQLSPPRRITKDDWQAVHASRLMRLRGHGSVNVDSPETTRAEMEGDKRGFGLGYFGPSGEITHHLWIHAANAGPGPYFIKWMSWQTGEQLIELLAIVKSLGDQVHLVSLDEPAGIQLQDLLRQPFKGRKLTKRSEFEKTCTACACWQVRILDLPGCLARTHLPCADLRFNLRLADPIETLLDANAPWRGTGGEYIITLGSDSSAVPGEKLSLPRLKASVNAFTRIWLGVRPATGLAITDTLSGPPELLSDLDRALLLPQPHLGWDI